MILGLTDFSGTIVETARAIGAPVLVSANRLSVFETLATPTARFPRPLREWLRFSEPGQKLKHLAGMRVWLDSAGFTAQSRYRGYPWTVSAYVEMAAAWPFERWASMDYCVEREIARHQDEVRERMARTVRANLDCRREGIERGIDGAFMPVIQGSSPEDYARCIDWMPWLDEYPVIGVGSMRRRDTPGLDGIFAVIRGLERELPSGAKVHLFGVKSDAAEVLRNHPLINSMDSCAYGVAARRDALRRRRQFQERALNYDLFGEDAAIPRKTNGVVATAMADWMGRQARILSKPGRGALQASLPLPAQPGASAGSAYELAVAVMLARHNALVMSGDLDHDSMSRPQDAWMLARDLVDDWIEEGFVDPGDRILDAGPLHAALAAAEAGFWP